MARVKISELNAKTTAEDTDLLPIVDTTSEETKKISVGDLLQNYEIKGDILYTREPEQFTSFAVPMSLFEGYNYYEIIWIDQYYDTNPFWGYLHTTGKLPFKIGDTYRPTILKNHQANAGTDQQTITSHFIACRVVSLNDYNMGFHKCEYYDLMNNTYNDFLTGLIQPLIIIGYK